MSYHADPDVLSTASQPTSPILTRRSLLGGAVIATLGGAAALGGCAPTPSRDTTPQDSAPSMDSTAPRDIDREESVDIVVAGSGTAGTCAAVRAAELGAKVLCLEKLNFLGGTSSITEYMSGVNNPLQIEAGLEIDPAVPFRAIMDFENWGALGEVVWEFMTKSGETIEWLQQTGVQFTADYTALNIMPELRYCLTGSVNGSYARNGDTVLAPLRDFGAQFGDKLEFRTNCPVTDLVIEEGKISGVYATDADGAVIKINAKAVIFCSGGFSSNSELYERMLLRPYDDIHFFGFEGRDGDALRLAEPLGARLQAPSVLNYSLVSAVEGVPGFDDEVNVWFGSYPLLYVNAKGERFMDEGLTASMNPAPRNIAIMGAGICYGIADEAKVAAWDDMGAYNWGTGATPGTLRESIERCEGIIVADTLEELADKLAIDAATLRATVDTWNAIAQGASDPLYQTSPEVAAQDPIGEGPYYAARLRASSYGTGGGLSTNASFQVIREDRTPIEGLYAAGTDNGSAYYNDYPMPVFASFQQGFCATSGRLAAEHAVKSYMK